MQDDLEAATHAYREAQAAVEAAKAEAKQLVADARTNVTRTRERLAGAIVAAALAGRRQRDIAETTGYQREQVRRILRAGGVEPE